MVFASMVYTYILANVTSLLLQTDAKVETYRSRLTSIENFMRSKNVSQKVKELVRAHMQHMFERSDLDERVLEDLPAILRMEIKRAANFHVIQTCDVFNGCSSSLPRVLSSYLRRH